MPSEAELEQQPRIELPFRVVNLDSNEGYSPSGCVAGVGNQPDALDFSDRSSVLKLAYLPATRRVDPKALDVSDLAAMAAGSLGCLDSGGASARCNEREHRQAETGYMSQAFLPVDLTRALKGANPVS